MILYVFQVLVAAPVSVAQDSISSNIPNCTDDQYNWVSTRFATLLAQNRPK